MLLEFHLINTFLTEKLKIYYLFYCVIILLFICRSLVFQKITFMLGKVGIEFIFLQYNSFFHYFVVIHTYIFRKGIYMNIMRVFSTNFYCIDLLGYPCTKITLLLSLHHDRFIVFSYFMSKMTILSFSLWSLISNLWIYILWYTFGISLCLQKKSLWDLNWN